MSKLFFQKKYGSEIPYLPAVWTHVQTFVVFFLKASLSHSTASLEVDQFAEILLQLYPAMTMMENII